MPRHSSEKKTYLNISFGKIREKVTQDTPGAVSRENKNGDIVWEIVDNSVEGKITNIYYKEHHEYGNSYEITIDDGDEVFNLSLSEDSKFAVQFLSKFPNINLNEFVTIAPYEFTPQGSDKKKSGLNLYQGDNKIEDYFRTWNDGVWTYNNGFPEPGFEFGKASKTQIKRYALDVQDFLHNYFETECRQKLDSVSVEDHNHFPDKVDKPEGEDDDLPF